MNRYPWLDEYLRSKPGALSDYKPEWGWQRYQVGGKLFAAVCQPGAEHKGYDEREIVTLKCEPLLAEALRAEYPDVIPGFYMDKRCWNSVFLDGALPEDALRGLCDRSYELVFSKLTRKLQTEITEQTRESAAEHCIIRPWRRSDAAELSQMLNNRHVMDNLRDGLPYPYGEADALAYIDAMLSADPNETFAFAITAGGRVIGSIGAFRQGNVHRRTTEMGYYIGEPYWGRGYASEAAGQLCRYVFAHTDILRIFAEPFAYNLASCRVLEKNGFRLEGTMRSNAVKNGRVLDMQLYALVREAGDDNAV